MKNLNFADEHKIGVAKGVDEEVLAGLRDHFAGECTEAGMYLAMSRQADREGYPEVAEAFKRYAFEEAEHAAKFAELLGEVVDPCTKTNLRNRVLAEHGATQSKKDIATRAKELGYDAIHDTVHEMAKDEARHGSGFLGLLERFFGGLTEADLATDSSDEVICHCKKVTRGDINEAIKAGHTTLDAVKEHTSAGTACGGCLSKIKEIVESK